MHPIYGSTLTLLQQKHNAKACRDVMRSEYFSFLFLLFENVKYTWVSLSWSLKLVGLPFFRQLMPPSHTILVVDRQTLISRSLGDVKPCLIRKLTASLVAIFQWCDGQFRHFRSLLTHSIVNELSDFQLDLPPGAPISQDEAIIVLVSVWTKPATLTLHDTTIWPHRYFFVLPLFKLVIKS